MLERVEEARLGEGESGLRAETDGWFIVNVAESEGMRTDRFGAAVRFDERVRFAEFGINVRVLEPGQPNCLYHRESAQEAFLVLSGECVAVVEEEERPMHKGDFLSCPPGTAHVIVGAGDRPCAVLMVGTRKDPEELLYPVSEAAARHGASVDAETPSEEEAYAGTDSARSASLALPW